MKRTLYSWRHWGILGVAIVAVAVLLLARGFAADKALPKPPAPLARAVMPDAVVNGNVNFVQPAPANAVKELSDFSKFGIELPTEQLLAARTVPAAAPPAPEFLNPKVQPGKVRWHKTLADACTAAKKSGKPVLLFQMMGKLDERFC